MISNKKALVLSPALLFIFLSCSENYSSFEIDPITHDTINRVNENGKQGLWKIELCTSGLPPIPDSSQSKFKIAPVVFNPTVLQVGNYIDDKKQGVWTYYRKDGTIEKTVEFKDDSLVINY